LMHPKKKTIGLRIPSNPICQALLKELGFFYQMPGQMAFASIIYGFFYGLWPISWIIIGAVFLYKISV
ncbi:L-lactate permease, partial [Acinetobacter baumannii]|nr:L-lactate permease [Acinetobacter baumannii]